MVTETSLLAYSEVLETLGERQRLVYNAIKELGEADNLQISKYLNIPINSITPRVKELRDKKLVGVSKVDKSNITGRQVIFWKVVK
jgi:Mn-dependent DtxR family transcriptional regulator